MHIGMQGLAGYLLPAMMVLLRPADPLQSLAAPLLLDHRHSAVPGHLAHLQPGRLLHRPPAGGGRKLPHLRLAARPGAAREPAQTPEGGTRDEGTPAGDVRRADHSRHDRSRRDGPAGDRSPADRRIRLRLGPGPGPGRPRRGPRSHQLSGGPPALRVGRPEPSGVKRPRAVRHPAAPPEGLTARQRAAPTPARSLRPSARSRQSCPPPPSDLPTPSDLPPPPSSPPA